MDEDISHKAAFITRNAVYEWLLWSSEFTDKFSNDNDSEQPWNIGVC
jgi:hypothetical protein